MHYNILGKSGFNPVLVLLLIIVFLALSASTSSCETSVASSGCGYQDYQCMARQDAYSAGIDAQLFVNQINQESGFNPNAVSNAGAIGIAQIMPDTAASWNVDPWNPVNSLSAAAQHMAGYVNTYKGDYRKALACYNAGCGRLEWAMANCQYYYWCLPRETENYIDKVMN